MTSSAPHCPHPRRAAILATGALALGLLAPAAAGAATDTPIAPSTYETGVPADQVEHGVYTYTITGSARPQAKRIEYWISGSRWRDEATDARTGEKLNARVHDGSGTTWIQYENGIDGDPPVLHFAGNDSVPGPGQPAPYNTKVLAGQLKVASSYGPGVLSYQPIGPVTIAGIAGTRYEQLTDGLPGFQEPGTDADEGSHQYVVLENGTNRPLQRETVAPNGIYGTFDQKETLVSRQTTRSRSAVAYVSRATIKKTVSRWKARAARKKTKKR